MHPELANVLDTLGQRVAQFEQRFADERQKLANRRLAEWAKDKPHFEAVREQMAEMVNAEFLMARQGYPANRLIRNDEIDMDAAYQAAVWSSPEIRAKMLEAERAKLSASAGQGQAVASARRAGASIRPGAPISGSLNGVGEQSHRRESVRDSIKRAMVNR